jgi:undecaprenyl pyrophosphate phosphatase UppP
MRFIQRNNLAGFVWYRVGTAVVVLAVQALGLR